MIRKKKHQRPVAAGESAYDFSGISTVKNYFDWYREGDVEGNTDPSDKNSEIKTILYVSLGAIALTGILIFVLGRRRK